VGGRDNQAVHRGDVLFRPTMGRLALRSTNPSTALGSVFATCARDWVTVRGVVTSDIAGKHESTRVALDVEAKYDPIESLTLFVRPDITSADGNLQPDSFRRVGGEIVVKPRSGSETSPGSAPANRT
jgi:hypothetical protein